jgi:hypothetical protein
MLGGFGADIFKGAGSSSRVVMHNVMRIKVVCFKPEAGVAMALATPPPAGYAPNNISIFTTEICGLVNCNRRCYNNDIHLQRHVVFMAPDQSNKERVASYGPGAGYTLVQLNATRLCEEFYSDQVNALCAVNHHMVVMDHNYVSTAQRPCQNDSASDIMQLRSQPIFARVIMVVYVCAVAFGQSLPPCRASLVAVSASAGVAAVALSSLGSWSAGSK